MGSAPVRLLLRRAAAAGRAGGAGLVGSLRQTIRQLPRFLVVSGTRPTREAGARVLNLKLKDNSVAETLFCGVHDPGTCIPLSLSKNFIHERCVAASQTHAFISVRCTCPPSPSVPPPPLFSFSVPLSLRLSHTLVLARSLSFTLPSSPSSSFSSRPTPPYTPPPIPSSHSFSARWLDGALPGCPGLPLAAGGGVVHRPYGAPAPPWCRAAQGCLLPPGSGRGC